MASSLMCFSSHFDVPGTSLTVKEAAGTKQSQTPHAPGHGPREPHRLGEQATGLKATWVTERKWGVARPSLQAATWLSQLSC